ncbi:MAG: GNAT family N-acetyltransferase [Candidatus Scalindua rubra]|nr:GNAT family N-acetyltransferase [Candidatus Scalindua rubra]
MKKSRSDTVFLTWEWMYTWWECFKGNKQLFLLTAYGEKKKLIGIAPLCMDKKKVVGITVLKYLRFLGTMPISSDHLDFIINREREGEVLKAIVDYLFQEIKWDLCLLSNIPISSLTSKLLREIMRNRPFQSEISQVCPYIPLPDQIEDFYLSLSRNMRNTIKRRRRNLFRKYDNIEFLAWENPDEIDSAMERLFELHEKRWMIVKHKGNFMKSNVRGFHKKIARTFLKSDMLRLYFLRVQGKDVAALYFFKYKNMLFYYQGGWDPKWSEDRVGNILTNLVIEDAINKGYSEYDFLRGTEDYKVRLTDKKREEIDIFISNSYTAKIYLLSRSLYHKMKEYGNKKRI